VVWGSVKQILTAELYAEPAKAQKRCRRPAGLVSHHLVEPVASRARNGAID
jgi:hypothetical protein